MKILFVCTGNTCRSPMAEAFLNMIAKENNDSTVCAFSRGLAAYGEPASKYSVEASKEFGAQIDSHISGQLTMDDISDSDIVLTMTKDQSMFLKSEAKKFNDKIFSISEYVDTAEISDPYGQNIDAYKKCAELLYNACQKIYKKYLEGQI